MRPNQEWDADVGLAGIGGRAAEVLACEISQHIDAHLLPCRFHVAMLSRVARKLGHLLPEGGGVGGGGGGAQKGGGGGVFFVFFFWFFCLFFFLSPPPPPGGGGAPPRGGGGGRVQNSQADFNSDDSPALAGINYANRFGKVTSGLTVSHTKPGTNRIASWPGELLRTLLRRCLACRCVT